jgi:F420-dependent oxidoreductase-like protein
MGVSGPQVVEGWYGVPFARPLARAREYVSIVRSVMKRDSEVVNDGPYYPLPVPGGTGLGKPLKIMLHPRRANLPIFLGAEGPKNIELAAEIADGWIPNYFAPRRDQEYRAMLARGFERAGSGKSIDGFAVAPTVVVRVTDDRAAALEAEKTRHAQVLGGMGARTANFHADAAARLGYEREVAQVQDLWRDGKRGEAATAVPTKLIEDVALIGSVAQIRDDLERWRESIVTTIIARPADLAELRRIAEAILG